MDEIPVRNFAAFLLPLFITIAGAGLGWSTSAALAWLERDDEMVRAFVSTFRSEKSTALRTELYRTLLREVGPEKAQDALLATGIPADGSAHNIQHEAGLYLYDTRGIEGIVLCKPTFRYACHHAFVIEAIAERGQKAIPEIMKRCSTEGRFVATQCAHGIGHGFEALYEYSDLPRAIRDCRSGIGTSSPTNLYWCFAGIFMENAIGFHEGAPSPYRLYNASDPFYPCNEKFVKKMARRACLIVQSENTLYLYPMFNRYISKAASFCGTQKEGLVRRICFDGLSRQIHQISRGSNEEMRRLCKLLGNHLEEPCIATIANNAYFYGDNVTAVALCDSVREEYRNTCVALVSLQIRARYDTLSERVRACEIFSRDEEKETCIKVVESMRRVPRAFR